MSDWQRPTPPPDESPQRTYWSRSSTSDPLSPGQLIRRAWRHYQSAPRRFLLVAIIPETLRGLLALPGLVAAVLVAQATFDVIADFFARVAANPDAYRDPNSQALQTELESQLRAATLPHTDLAALTAVGGGAGIVVGLIGTCALIAAALAAASGQRISVGGAFRLVASRGALLKPILAIGIGGGLVSWVPVTVQASTGFQTWAGVPGSPRSVLLASLLAVFALVFVVAIVVMAVRWALYIPAVLVEGLGVGAGLARAAELSHGIRIRLCLATAGIVILQGLIVGIAAAPIGLGVGLAARSVAAGVWAFLLSSLFGSLLWAPLLPSMLALAYRERSRGAASESTAST